jgi:hypothetical protein
MFIHLTPELIKDLNDNTERIRSDPIAMELLSRKRESTFTFSLKENAYEILKFWEDPESSSRHGNTFTYSGYPGGFFFVDSITNLSENVITFKLNDFEFIIPSDEYRRFDLPIQLLMFVSKRIDYTPKFGIYTKNKVREIVSECINRRNKIGDEIQNTFFDDHLHKHSVTVVCDVETISFPIIDQPIFKVHGDMRVYDKETLGGGCIRWHNHIIGNGSIGFVGGMEA